MDGEERSRSVYHGSIAQLKGSVPIQPELDGRTRGQSTDSAHFDSRDTNRRVVLDNRTFRDHFGDRHVQRRGNVQSLCPTDALQQQSTRPEHLLDSSPQPHSGSFRSDDSFRPTSRTTLYSHTDRWWYDPQEEGRFHEQLTDRPSYARDHTYPQFTDVSRRNRFPSYHEQMRERAAFAESHNFRYREQGMNSQDMSRTDFDMVPYYDRGHHASADFSSASSRYRDTSAYVGQASHTNGRHRSSDKASESGMFDKRQKNQRTDNSNAYHHRRSHSGSSMSQEGASESVGGRSVNMPAMSSTLKRRKRAILSCIECKQRKIKCDRNVPNCSSCVRRGVAHLCRWGDERDSVYGAQSSSVTPSNAALMARIAQLETHVRELQAAQPFKPPRTRPSISAEPVHTAQGVTKPSSVASPSQGLLPGDRHCVDELPDSNDQKGSNRCLRSEQSSSSSPAEHNKSSEHSDSTFDDTDRRSDRKLRDVSNRNFAREKVSAVERNDASRDRSRCKRRSRPYSPLGPVIGLFEEDRNHETIRREMMQILELLPSRESTEIMIDFYIREAEPIINSIHLPSFKIKLTKFWRDYKRARRSANLQDSLVTPDRQFAALLFAMIEGACEYMTPLEIMASGICTSRSTIGVQLKRLSSSCLTLLGVDGFVKQPRLCGLQALIALRHFYLNSGNTDEYLVLLHMAMKSAENIGLHKLGSALQDEDRWAKYDGAQGPVGIDTSSSRLIRWNTQAKAVHRWRAQIFHGTKVDLATGYESDTVDHLGGDYSSIWLHRKSQRMLWDHRAQTQFVDGSRVQRETGRKVWLAMASLSWQYATHLGCYDLASGHAFDTQVPRNIDDEDIQDTFSDGDEELSSTRRRAGVKSFSLSIRAREDPTINSFVPIHFEICDIARSIAHGLSRDAEPINTVASIEARFRNTLSSLPLFFRLDGRSEYDPTIQQLHRDRPYLSFQRAVIHEHVHLHLLKLHRLLMNRGYRNTKHVHSTRTCIEGARVVIAILSSLDQVGCRGHKCWVFRTHIFHAVTVLQIDLLYLARQQVTSETEAKRADIIVGLKMLHARTDVEGKNPILASLLKMIKTLREEESLRQARTGSSTTETSGTSSSSDDHGSQGSEPEDEATNRQWTKASESTGQLADDLGRRIQDTWRSAGSEILSRKMTLVNNTPQTAETGPDGFKTAESTAESTSTSTQTVAQSNQLPAESTNLEMRVDNRDTDLDSYLDLLTSYQNPHKIGNGCRVFNMLNDSIFDNASMTKLTFTTSAPLVSEHALTVSDDFMPLIRNDADLAAAGAGFDGFTAV